MQRERGLSVSIRELLRIVHYIASHPDSSRYEMAEDLGINMRTLVRKLDVIEQALQVRFSKSSSFSYRGGKRVLYRVSDFGVINKKAVMNMFAKEAELE